MESMQNDRCQLHVTGTGANRVTITIIIIYGGVVMAQSYCKSSSGSFDECRLSAGWPPALRPSQSTWAVSPPKLADAICIHHRHSLLLLSLQADTHFTVPWKVEGWVDVHCSRDAQSVVKAVYHSGCRDKQQPSAVRFEHGSHHITVRSANH